MKQKINPLILALALGVGLILLLPGCTTSKSSNPEEEDPVAMANQNCTQCHGQDDRIVAKQLQWEESKHAQGTSFAYAGGRSYCFPCHNGSNFNAAYNFDSLPDNLTYGAARVDCRTCHDIHLAFDSTDWKLTTTDPVNLLIDSAVTIDFGKGNLCVNCHQPRRNPMASVTGDSVEITSSHWGPHHGPMAAMVQGVGGYEVSGSLTKASSAHVTAVKDGCVECHLSDNDHDFEPVVSACAECHTDAKDFDYRSVQTEVKALLAEALDSCLAAGIVSLDSIKELTGFLDDSNNVEYDIHTELHGEKGTFSKEIAGLYQNYLFVLEDRSFGVHNAKYAKYLLTNALEAIKP